MLTLVVLCGCSRLRLSGEQPDRVEGVTVDVVTVGTRVTEVMDDSVLGEAGRLLFPVEDWYWRGDTLGSLSYTWYTQLDARPSVDVVNRLRSDATEGEQVFYDIYADEKKRVDPAKHTPVSTSSAEIPECTWPS